MKAFSVIFSGFFSKANAKPETYVIDPYHTQVLWKANHGGLSNMYGKFADVTGTIIIDEANASKSKADIKVKVESIVTGLKALDEELLKSNFLDAKKHPIAHFVTNKVELTGEKEAVVHGKLTLNWITKNVIMNTKFYGKGVQPYSQKPVVGFSGKIKINRQDFKIGTEFSNSLIGNEVEIIIETEATIKE